MAVDSTPALPVEAVAQATRVRIFPSFHVQQPSLTPHTSRQQAQRDGVFAGLSSGLVSGASPLP